MSQPLTRSTGPERPESNCDGVLVAEDDPMFRKILKSWLENWGYRVIVADDGTAAWNILQQERPPELLILDWVMPGIDGLQLCRRIRERQTTPYQYILLITAKDDAEDVVTGLEAGADDYLTKPLDRSELRARLRGGRRILTRSEEHTSELHSATLRPCGGMGRAWWGGWRAYLLTASPTGSTGATSGRGCEWEDVSS